MTERVMSGQQTPKPVTAAPATIGPVTEPAATTGPETTDPVTAEPATPAAAPVPVPDDELTGGEALVRALAAHGVTQAFGIPGTHNLEIYRHLAAYRIDHLNPRHEQGAGYAADAYARVSGQPGVAITTTGPALLNIAAAVGQAYSDSVPLLVPSPGMPLRHPRQSTGLLHEMRSQTEALRAVAAVSHRVSSVAEIGVAVARAFTLFRTQRPRPVHIEVPLDLLTAVEPAGPVRTAPSAAPAVAEAGAVSAAAEALRAAARPAMVLGGGAREAAAECLQLAAELGAPVVTSTNGKGIVAETHPLSLGVSLHSPAVQRWLGERDVVLAVGTELAESDLWQAPPALSGILIRADVDPAQMYAGLPADIPLVGDARHTLRSLLSACRGDAPGTRSAQVPGIARPDVDAAHRAVVALRDERDDETRSQDARWLPYLAEIRSVLPADAVITSDSAQCCYYGAIPHLPVAPEGRYLHPTGFGTLGYALPAAIGAKTADPVRPVVALSGDGGLQFSVQELATAVQLRLPLPVVVFDNGGYGEIRDEMASRGDRPTGVDLPPVDLPALARAYGGHGVRVDSPEALAEALRRAPWTPQDPLSSPFLRSSPDDHVPHHVADLRRARDDRIGGVGDGRSHRPPGLPHLDRPRDGAPGAPGHRPSGARCLQRRPADALRLHAGGSSRPGPRYDDEGGVALQPAGHYIPMGGAKGGIDCDPRDPAAYGILVRYLRAVRPYIEHFWTTGEDLGLTQDLVDQAAAEVGLVSSIQAVYPLLDDEEAARRRLADAFAIDVDGIGLDELVGGCGVAESVLAALDRAGVAHQGTRVAVQGFGTMGGATARFLARAGLRVVAVADIKGTIANSAGLDIETLLAARDGHGCVDRAALRAEDSELPAGAWLTADAEVLVPAAVSYAVTAANQAGVTAGWIVEAANMPVVPEAEALLAARGITVLPDVVVNSGTNAWWWTLFGDIGADADEAFAYTRRSMRALIDQMLARAETEGCTPRVAAHALVADRLPVIAERFGWFR